MSKMLDAALEYAAIGWPIFPCKANKSPYTKNGVLDATTSKKKIKEWWDTWPHANIGLDVGSINIMVLDLDPGHDMKELERNVGKIPATQLLQHTPRGGKHLFLALSEGEIVPASASKLANNVDVRSFNSYVLLAPSKTSRGSYTWEIDPRKHRSLVPAYRTDSILSAARGGRDNKKNTGRRDADNWLIEADLPENIEDAVRWLKNDARVAIQGAGGDHAAYATAAMCKSYGLSPETAFDVMWEHWNPRCIPPWRPDEIEHFQAKIENSYKYGTSAPGNMTPAYRAAKVQELFKPVLRNTSENGQEIKGRFRIVARAGIEEINPPRWLIKDTVPEQGYVLIVAPRSSGKTFVALDVSLSVATGTYNFFNDDEGWEGNWPEAGGGGNVLFATGEGRSGLKNRILAWEHMFLEGHKAKKLAIVDPVVRPFTDNIDAFISEAKAFNPKGYDLVVLDTVGRSMQGLNENSQEDASAFTAMVESIQRKLGAAVVAIHHTGHGDQARSRGSSVFEADADAVFVLERDHKSMILQMRNTKQKDALEWENPKFIKLSKVKIGDAETLVATKPTKEDVTEQNVLRKGRKGSRSRQDVHADLVLIRDVAFDYLKSVPAKEFSNSKLAEGIASDERVSITVSSIRQRYVQHLLTDKNHPVSKCYDRAKNAWVYRSKRGR